MPWMVVSILLGAVGQVLLKVSARNLHRLTAGNGPVSQSLLRLVAMPVMWVGIVLFAVSMLLWIKALTTAPLGLAYPMVSLGYVVVAVLSWIFFGESVTMWQILGIATIIVGVIVLGASQGRAL